MLLMYPSRVILVILTAVLVLTTLYQWQEEFRRGTQWTFFPPQKSSPHDEYLTKCNSWTLDRHIYFTSKKECKDKLERIRI